MLHQAGRDLGRADDDRDREGQEGHAGLHGRVVEDDLEVVGHEQEHAEHADDREAHRQEAAGAVAVLDDVEGQEGAGRPVLPPDEGDKEYDACREQAQDQGVRPAARFRLAEAVDDRHESAAAQEYAGHVEAGAAVARAVVEQGEGAEDRDDRDGDVDVEAPAPVQVLREQPARDEADRRTAARECAVDPEGLAAFLRVRERRGQEAERGGGQYGGEDALEGAGAEEHARARGGAAQCGGAREADQADDERPFAAHQVGDPAAQQEQAAEREGVRRDDPLPVAVGHAQVALCGGECDVHDRRVEDDHELRESDDHQAPPAPGIGLVRRG